MTKNICSTLVILAIIFLGGCEQNSVHTTKGHLIIIGGGSRPEIIMRKFVDLAGGSEARIAIIPMASEYYQEGGKRTEKEFIELGVEEARAFYIPDSLQACSDSTLTALESYTGYFFGGGNQNRLTEIFNGTLAHELFHRRYSEGAVLGGTSAGAAIMSN
ncbi:MAG: hypothetical protein EH225_05855, partial [Calditrichaeota bacterium]